MIWDLRGALLKKQENETARLLDFEFRLRARTMRALAASMGGSIEADELIGQIALHPDEEILRRLRELHPDLDIDAKYVAARAAARAQLIDELGDPSPTRLA